MLRHSLLVAGAVLLAASAAAQDAPLATGPAVGEAIPAFSAVDQNGQRQSFDSLKGPNGLLLLFHRSADW
jgi:cytochrome oxidase Cu insertion factor (SCO1/SenC/PrrC family)